MLHLLPTRYLLMAIILLVSMVVLAGVYAGLLGTGDAIADVSWVIRSASVGAVFLMLLPCVSWRWIPALQRMVFPYLGGVWSGRLLFNSPNGAGQREVTLTIRHSLLGIALILDSAESTSRTLVVKADRDSGIDRDRLYYVYLNERKEGVPGAGDRYRGLAVLRIDRSGELALVGDYFTEGQRNGTLSLNRRRSHPFWAFWK